MYLCVQQVVSPPGGSREKAVAGHQGPSHHKPAGDIRETVPLLLVHYYRKI
jgi:hypothetical protein